MGKPNLEATKDSLHRDFGTDPQQIVINRPTHPMAIKGASVAVAAGQIVVPVGETPRSPKSRIKIEFANVPSYDSGPDVAKTPQGLVQSADEILADKAVALTATGSEISRRLGCLVSCQTGCTLGPIATWSSGNLSTTAFPISK